MALIKITFDNASVTSKQDADCNHFLANKQNGVVDGILGRCQPSISNSYIQFQSGYVQVYGRRVFVESGTKIAISLDGNAYGYVIIKFDLGNNAVTLEKKEASSGYPTLTQNDLMNGGLIYEFPLTRYQKTTSSITIDSSWSVPLIELPLPIAKQALLVANGIKLKCKTKSAYFVDSGTYDVHKTVTFDLSDVGYYDIIVIKFHSVDFEAYGAVQYIYGTFITNKISLNYTHQDMFIRKQRTSSDTYRDIRAFAYNYDYSDTITVGFPSSTDNMDIPSGVTLYIYSVGQ